MDEGYDKLASLISTYPELAVVRKFGALSMKCLLYRQAEITWIEHELERQSVWDRADPEKANLCKSWYDFTHAPEDEDLAHHRQKIDELQEKIRAYHTMLLQLTEVFKLLEGRGANLETLRTWLARPEGGGHFLNAVEFGPWSSAHENDMITLLPASNADKFGQRLGDTFSPIYHAMIGRHRPPSSDPRLGPVWSYDKGAFTLAGNAICMVLSFVMPTGSIFALYYVSSMLARLLMMSGFILIFAFVMMFAVGSRRGEVFAATAAFAAIQVVFIGGFNNNQQV